MSDTLYLDCFAGISGDMAVSALLDCGVSIGNLQKDLTNLDLAGFQISVEKDTTASLAATSFKVATGDNHPPRHWSEIKKLLATSRLSEPVKEMAIAIFTTLAVAEAKIHNCTVEQVHFHEVGAVDSIIDIASFAICYAELGIKKVICSPLPMPGGTVSCAHGLLPLPAPAVCEILKDVPVYGVDLKQELVTPTGAAIIKTIAESFGPFPSMTIRKVGYGRGSRELADGRPNLLRAVLGKINNVEEAQEIEVIDCNLDDWSPEGYPMLADKLFSLGALDVILVPVQMKKGRPGFQLQVICKPGLGWEIRRCILSETTAIGVRYRSENRWTLPRRTGTVETAHGRVVVKLVETPRGAVLYPEYEDCRRLAKEKDLPLKDIYTAVALCSHNDFSGEDD